MTILVLVLVLAACSLIAFLESRPGPHYAAGYSPGTLCRNYGAAGAEVCEHDPDYRASRIAKQPHFP